MPLRFLHTSDIHLLDLQGVKPWRYVGKRLTGRLNLALGRSRVHQSRLFDLMMERAPKLGAQRVVLTGDLTNLSLESEFALVRRKLDALPLPVTVIPGNHDAYTRGSERSRRFESFLRPHMQGERQGDADYPFVWRADDVALVGLSTAVATPLFNATGRLGEHQLERLDRVLEALGNQGLGRVVLIHHPVVEGVAHSGHHLHDLAEFGEVIARRGAELVLHGHEHTTIDSALPGPHGPVPVHGIASGTSTSQTPNRRASFSIYDVAARRITRKRYEWNGNEFELCPA